MGVSDVDGNCYTMENGRLVLAATVVKGTFVERSECTPFEWKMIQEKKNSFWGRLLDW